VEASVGHRDSSADSFGGQDAALCRRLLIAGIVIEPQERRTVMVGWTAFGGVQAD